MNKNKFKILNKKFVQSKGFTLVELIIVIVVLAILAALTMNLLRPAQQLENQRNAQRRADLISILNAIKQYSFDNNGSLPSTIMLASDCVNPGMGILAPICKTGVANLTCVVNSSINLQVLTDNSKYLVSIPIDPKNTSQYSTGYNVIKDSNNRVTVCAPLTEATTTIISFTR